MPGFVKLATRDQLPLGAALEVEHEGRIIALFHQDGGIVALDGICPHQGGPLAQGQVRNGILTCPWHGWQFHLASGCLTTNERICQPRYPVQLEGENILVELP